MYLGLIKQNNSWHAVSQVQGPQAGCVVVRGQKWIFQPLIEMYRAYENE